MEDLTQDKSALNIPESKPSKSYMKNVMQSHIDAINNSNMKGPSFAENFRGEDPVGTTPISTGGGDMIKELKEVFDVPFIPKKQNWLLQFVHLSEILRLWPSNYT